MPTPPSRSSASKRENEKALYRLRRRPVCSTSGGVLCQCFGKDSATEEAQVVAYGARPGMLVLDETAGVWR